MGGNVSIQTFIRYPSWNRHETLAILFGYGNHSLDFGTSPGLLSPMSARAVSSVSKSLRSDQVVSLLVSGTRDFIRLTKVLHDISQRLVDIAFNPKVIKFPFN